MVSLRLDVINRILGGGAPALDDNGSHRDRAHHEQAADVGHLEPYDGIIHIPRTDSLKESGRWLKVFGSERFLLYLCIRKQKRNDASYDQYNK